MTTLELGRYTTIYFWHFFIKELNSNFSIHTESTHDNLLYVTPFG